MPKYLPADQVSRTLNLEGRAFTTIVGRHDHRLTDADFNAAQDLQDEKLKSYFHANLFSGCLEYKPFQFIPTDENRFMIPGFKAMLNGRVVDIVGHGTSKASTNLVTLPTRTRESAYWTPTSDPLGQAKIYTVYLEFWERYLDVETGNGYFIDKKGDRWIYPNGNINASPDTLLPDDARDPFEDLKTTARTQIQWAIRCHPLSLEYDFKQSPSGLDDRQYINQQVYGQGFLPSTLPLAPYTFKSMGPVNGDYGLWRSGIEGPMSALGTVDGFTYAIPLGLVFQRNTGNFDVSVNPFGCADTTTRISGMLRDNVSGRPDGKYADVVYPEDVVDTRNVTYVDQEDPEILLNRGFTDLITGATSLKVARGDSFGCSAYALGSKLPYTVFIGPDPRPQMTHLGKFDGYMNGFSSDERNQFVTKCFTVNDKASGVKGERWSKGDSIKVDLDGNAQSPVRSRVYIKDVIVQVSVPNPQTQASQVTMLYTGQVDIQVSGRSAVVTISDNLSGSAFDPNMGSIYLTLNVVYPGGSGYDLKVIPSSLAGGQLFDQSLSKILPVFGVSDYEISHNIVGNSDYRLDAYNPNYSTTSFGTTYSVKVPASSGVLKKDGAVPSWVLSLPRKNLLGKHTAIDALAAQESLLGDTRRDLTVLSRTVTPDTIIVEVNGDYTGRNTSIWVTLQLIDTAQLSYNAPVKGVMALEETVIVGRSPAPQYGLLPDPRIQVVDATTTATSTTIVLGVNHGTIKGFSGIKGVKTIFAGGPSGYTAYPVDDLVIYNGMAMITVANDIVNLSTTSWFLVMSLLPAVNSSSFMYLTSLYVPYQGEGVEGREYQVLFSEDDALVTTNGTGAAPVPGLRDVFPFNREFPIAAALPSQASWKDSDLTNQSLNVQFGNNYEAKRQSNVEHTIKTALRTNDFIQPLTGWQRKTFTLRVAAGRGFANSYPHTGFAIKKPQARSVLGDSVQSTTSPITIYVSNTVGRDTNDGLKPTSPKLTIQAALSVLPPVLRHPVSIYLMDTDVPYLMTKMAAEGSIRAAVLGSGQSRKDPKNYCVFNLSFEIQEAGRLLISKEPGASNPVEISARGFVPYGDGPLSAFVVDDSRVSFNGIKFSNFSNPALRILDSDVEISNSEFESNFQAMSLDEGSGVIITGSKLSLPAGGTGVVVNNSQVTLDNTSMVVETPAAGTPLTNYFVTAYNNSVVYLKGHTPTMDTDVRETTPVLYAKMGTVVVCEQDFSCLGTAKLALNSTMTVPVSNVPFRGGVDADKSSIVDRDQI